MDPLPHCMTAHPPLRQKVGDTLSEERKEILWTGGCQAQLGVGRL